MASFLSKGNRPAYDAPGLGLSALVLIAMWLISIIPSHAEPLVATSFKMAGDANHVRVVMEFNSEPEVKWFLLRSPYRLVVDLPPTGMQLDRKDLKARGLVNAVQFGSGAEGASRIVLSAKGPFAVDNLDVIKNEDSEGYRLAVDLSSTSTESYDQVLADQALTTAANRSTPKSDKPEVQKRFRIVLDPGHGGADGGAQGGTTGMAEKDVTLGFARTLRDVLNETGKYDVSMTRDTDVFIMLDERVRIARERGADLLISIHADTISVKGLRGATVYTVSDKASDPEAEALAIRENLADQVAGIDVGQTDTQVADILVDLIRRETHSFSIRFARSLVGELSTSIGVINNPHRFAGFRVLKAPDVPSVLVELGYLSNPKDEEQLQNVEWRQKAAKSIAAAVASFAQASSRAGG